MSSGADDIPGTKVPDGAKRGFHHTNPLLLRYFAEHVWGLGTPQLLITVTGGAMDFQLSADAKDSLLRGLTNATKTLRAWFVDGGTDAGIMKYMGEARAQYAVNTPLIGIATWGSIRGRQMMVRKEVARRLPSRGYPHHDRSMVNYVKAVRDFNAAHKDAKAAKLDHNHSHFFLADDGTCNVFGKEVVLRTSFEAAIAGGQSATKHILRQLENLGLGWQGLNHKAVLRAGRKQAKHVPAVCVCVQGGPGTIKTVRNAAGNGTPVLLIRGSGKAADLLADVAILVDRRRPLAGQRMGGLARSLAPSRRQQKLDEVLEELDSKCEGWFNEQAENVSKVVESIPTFDEIVGRFKTVLQSYGLVRPNDDE